MEPKNLCGAKRHVPKNLEGIFLKGLYASGARKSLTQAFTKRTLADQLGNFI